MKLTLLAMLAGLVLLVGCATEGTVYVESGYYAPPAVVFYEPWYIGPYYYQGYPYGHPYYRHNVPPVVPPHRPPPVVVPHRTERPAPPTRPPNPQPRPTR